MQVLRMLGLALVVLIALVAALFVGARFHDGPLGFIPGGPLSAGTRVETPVLDWSFAKDLGEIELQLESQKTSRTTWILVRDGAAYVPCSLSFPPGKNWYNEAQRDGRAVLRIEGQLHRVSLTRDDDPTLPAFARPEVVRKYGTPPPSDGGVLFFRVGARS